MIKPICKSEKHRVKKCSSCIYQFNGYTQRPCSKCYKTKIFPKYKEKSKD